MFSWKTWKTLKLELTVNCWTLRDVTWMIVSKYMLKCGFSLVYLIARIYGANESFVGNYLKNQNRIITTTILKLVLYPYIVEYLISSNDIRIVEHVPLLENY